MTDFWKALSCAHTSVSEMVDEDGNAICNGCGKPVTVRLSRGQLERGFEAIKRDFGPYGRHSMRCVETDDGWVCATDCQMVRK